MPRRSRLVGSLLVLALAAVQPGGARAAGAAAHFLVGAATRTVAPVDQSMATHVGGYGTCRGCPTTAVRAGDDFVVRAMYVSNGDHAVVMVAAPFEGWFAGYQQEFDRTGKQVERLGITSLRQDAATQLSAALGRPGAVGQQDIIVSTIHCHACPTLIGVWGPTNVVYLRYVYRQTLAAILAAQAAAVSATLRWATADIGYANDVTVGQANANEGWPIDGQLSVLQARAVDDSRVVASYMNVPIHGNIIAGPDLHEMDTEHFGAAARWIEQHEGGVAVVAAGTLGDQTSPMQGETTRDRNDQRPNDGRGYPVGYDVIDRLGALTGSTAEEALRFHGHDVTDATVGGAEQYQLVPTDNPVILGLIYGHAVPDVPGVKSGSNLAGNETADRAITPPYMAGIEVGVWFTTLRIGGIAIVSEPGEAFPHVSFSIRDSIPGADAVFTVGNAQDQLGYYFEPYAYPGTFYYSADHYTFYLGKTFAQQNIQSAMLDARQLGFAVAPSVSSITSVLGNDYTRVALKAGIQAWAYPHGANDPLPASTPGGIPVALGVYWNHARGSEVGVPNAEVPTGAPDVRVDGVPVPNVGNTMRQFVVVTVPCPGSYAIDVSLPGTSATWHSVMHVYSADEITNTTSYPDGTGPHPLALQNQNDLQTSC